MLSPPPAYSVIRRHPCIGLWLALIVPTFFSPSPARAGGLELVPTQRGVIAGHVGALEFLPSVGSFFVFEIKDAPPENRILKGPLRGNFQESVEQVSPSYYRVSGNHVPSNSVYVIEMKKASAQRIDLDLRFSTGSTAAKLRFEICRPNADLFKGGSLIFQPAALSDRKNVPLEAETWRHRHLARGKTFFSIQSPYASLTIRNLDKRNFLSVADFRSAPHGDQNVLFVYNKIKRMEPNKTYRFRYCIEIEQAGNDLSAGFQATRPKGGVAHAAGPPESLQSFFDISPVRFVPAAGTFEINANTVIHGRPDGAAESIIAREIQHIDYTVDALTLNEGMETVPPGIVFSRPRRPLISEDAFTVDINKNRVIVQAHTERAKLYAAWALVARMYAADQVGRIPCGRIEDSPDLRVRGMLLEASRAGSGNISHFKRYLEALSRVRCNVVVFYHEAEQIRQWRSPQKTGNRWWSQDAIGRVAEYARYLGLDVWAGVKAKYESKDFPELVMAPGSNIYDPRHQENYGYLFDLCSEVIATYKPSVFLIGHDEIKGFDAYTGGHSGSAARLFARDVTTLYDWLKRREIETAIWGDMLLDQKVWEKTVGHANSGYPGWGSRYTHLAVDLLPRDIWIIDWHYDIKPDYPSVGFFHNKGFRVLGCTWSRPVAGQNMAAGVKKAGAQGIIGSDWGLWATLSPSATTLYAPLCGWRSDCRPIPDLDRLALASMIRDDAHRQWMNAKPFALDGFFNASTWDSKAGDGYGFFDAGPAFDLRNLKPGSIAVGGVVYKIVSPRKGKQKNCILVANSAARMPQTPLDCNLPINEQRIGAVAFLHAASLDRPSYQNIVLGDYIVRYANGDSLKVSLRQGWNISDLRSRETLRGPWSFGTHADVIFGAQRAWVGKTAAGTPIHLQSYVWQNPWPHRTIKSITLRCKQNTQGIRLLVLAATLLY